ncbi:MAG: NAD-dependent epimerase/dehydratase family protein [Hyphomicrobiales bacterium]|nr:NAD-dependent epimerase/dehydratase family protein [Hyphomicrobiales bacterium]MCP5373722.1 NAD-dependent epimerase/dehydratase family protein [Hyphomicrobiales bacterium]
MKVVITGGTGFIGFRLARRLLERGQLTGPSGAPEAIDEMVLFDTAPAPADLSTAGVRVRVVTGDMADRATVAGLVDRDDISVFHLASVVSGGGEKDFDLAMGVNLYGGLHLFEALRARGGAPRLVFASSIAVFGGGAMAPVVDDFAKQTPQTTYGMTKAVGELMVNDYTRKGFLDGRAARLPTVIIRPGKPNAAASSFASAVFREPLMGRDYAAPVTPETAMAVLGARAAVDGLIHLHEVDGGDLGEDRAVQFPSLTLNVQEMVYALYRVAGDRPLGQVSFEPDPFVVDICSTWPRDARGTRAEALGFPQDADIDAIVGQFIEDYVDAPAAAPTGEGT